MISGWTLVKNGVTFDYPFTESLCSLLPFVEECIVNVGISSDGTLEKIQELAAVEKKIRILQSDWVLEEGGRAGTLLAQQTNLALAHCQHDWCFYLQADEVLHEKDRDCFLKAFEEGRKNPLCEGFLFDYIHFYGSYDVVQASRSAYRREVRLIKKSSGAQSVGDAQSFRKKNGEKLAVCLSHAHIFHYGWVRHPEAMREKTFFMDQLYHGKPSAEALRSGLPHTGLNYKYKKFFGLFYFQDRYPGTTHPQIMQPRIQKKNWSWDLSQAPWTFSWKDIKKIILDFLEKCFHYRFFEYRSYRLIRQPIFSKKRPKLLSNETD